MSRRANVAEEPFVWPRNADEIAAACDYLQEWTQKGYVDWPRPEGAARKALVKPAPGHAAFGVPHNTSDNEKR